MVDSQLTKQLATVNNYTNFNAFHYVQDYGVTEEIQPVAVEKPLEQSDDCVGDNSGSATLYGSVTTMVLCWMTAAIM